MNPESAPKPHALRSDIRSDIRSSLSEGAAFGGMVGFGETYVVAFVLAVGLGEITAGLVGSVPLLAGGLMQMVSPRGIRLLGSHKRWVVICAVVQALSLIPFVVSAALGVMSPAGALVATSLYWAAGLATGPAWNTWIGTVIPRSLRFRFFAIRTRASQAAVFLGFLVGGMSLHYAAANDRLLLAFALLFATACVCRLVSTVFLALQSEPTPIPPNMCQLSLRDILARLRTTDGGRLLVYLAAVQAAVQMAGPFFTPFMLEQLHMNYGVFTALISVAFLAKIFALPPLGRLAHRLGAWKLLWIGG
ncbi:MAG: MFS transporter, partial [Planctomycetota bacterium]|nr:MFS transporter [Planctomycetota bacterium]